MNCEFCRTLSGRFNAHRECCQLRLLAGAPDHTLLAVYQRVVSEEGTTALAELKKKLRAEYQRQQDHKSQVARQLHDQVAAKGREESAALLKKIKEMNMKVVTPHHPGPGHAYVKEVA